MARQMIAANEALFANLDAFCRKRSDPPILAGTKRWVHGDGEAQRFLRDLKINTLLKFGNHRALVHLSIDDTHYLGLLGFDFEPNLPNLTAVDDNPGVLVCLLSESSVSPVVSSAQVRNVIDIGHKGESGYDGHDAGAIRSLFPRIQLHRATQPLDEDSVWRTFLRFCAFECEQGGSWIEDELSSELMALTDLNVPELPYRELCKSMFDLDPRGLFMALYRCVEATYAYESSRKLVEALGISKTWQDLAGALETEIGWHPAEAASLNLILQHAHPADLEQLCECLKAQSHADLEIRTGRAIYGLRNRIVHYRLGMETVDAAQYDWNQICVCLIRIVYSIFARVQFRSPSESP